MSWRTKGKKCYYRARHKSTEFMSEKPGHEEDKTSSSRQSWAGQKLGKCTTWWMKRWLCWYVKKRFHLLSVSTARTENSTTLKLIRELLNEHGAEKNQPKVKEVTPTEKMKAIKQHSSVITVTWKRQNFLRKGQNCHTGF